MFGFGRSATFLLLALLAAIPPLVTVPLEMWFRRKGLLSDPATR